MYHTTEMYRTSNCLEKKENLMISTYYPWPKLTAGRRLCRVLSKCRIVCVFYTRMRKKTNELVIGTITYIDREGSWTLGLRIANLGLSL